MSSFTTGLKYQETNLVSNFGLPLYEITEGFDYMVGSLEEPLAVIRVENGFLTDFASIPWPLSLWFKPTGEWAKAAAVHDKLYHDYPEISRLVADSIFYEGCIVLGVNRVLALIFFLVLRMVNAFKA